MKTNSNENHLILGHVHAIRTYMGHINIIHQYVTVYCAFTFKAGLTAMQLLYIAFEFPLPKLRNPNLGDSSFLGYHSYWITASSKAVQSLCEYK